MIPLGSINRAGLALLVWALLLPLTPTARAEGMITVVAVGCEGIDETEVGRLLAIELDLAPSVRAMPPLSFEVTCSTDRIVIRADDPLTDKHVQRVLPMPRSKQRNAERELALAASQLMVASWLELLVNTGDTRPTRKTVDTPLLANARQSAHRAIIKERRHSEIALSGGTRLRLRQSYFPGLHLALDGGGWVTESVGLFGRLAMETGRLDQSNGQVVAYAGLAGARLAWRPIRLSIFSFETSLHGSCGYAYLQGDPADQAVGAFGVGGVTGEFGVDLTPVVWINRIGIGVNLTAGYMIKNPVGRVIDDQVSKVVLGGLFLGGTFSMRITV